MGKITFDDHDDAHTLEYAASMPLPDSESEPSSSEAELREAAADDASDSDMPEAVSLKTAKATQKNQEKLDRVAQQQSRKRKRTNTATPQSKKPVKGPAKRAEQSAESEAEDSEQDEFQPIASTSSAPAVAEPRSRSIKLDDGRLPTDLFAQAAAQEQAQKASQQEAKAAKASLKSKAKKRKAAALPDEGSSVTLPRGDTIQHLSNQDTTPRLTPANPRASSGLKPNSLVAPYSKTRKVHQGASATKHASDGSNTFSVKPKKSNVKKNAWKSRTESVRRDPALVAARDGKAGGIKGFVSGRLSSY